MVAYQHPSELNPLQRYRQASAILRGTSRASNEGWYANPLDLDFQLHLHIDGTRVESAVFHRPSETWSTGPKIDEELILDPSRVPEFTQEVINLAKKANTKAAGVIIHIADEFATTEIKPELDNPGALNELKELVAAEPKEVLDDGSLSVQEHSWRLIPYPAAGSETIATAITLSRHLAEFTEALRSHGNAKNFPVSTLSVSAPLIALISLPELHNSPLENPILAVLNYARFTVLAFFNEHGDLRLMRTLQHRGQRRPSNLRHAASTTAAAMEMANPDVVVMPLAGESDPQMVSDLETVFPSSDIKQINWQKTSNCSSTLPNIPPELFVATNYSKELSSPLAEAHTFVTLRNDGWALQDFLPLDAEKSEIFPLRSEMKLLRASRYARHGLVAATILALAWVSLGLLSMVRQPEWTFRQEEATVLNARLGALGKERNRILHWDNLLDD
ncbi:MAG: hypothetical protein ACPG4K_14955, partial [Haloferula sp.]